MTKLELACPRSERTEHGVRQIEIGIPNETRRGVLAPEALKALQSGSALGARQARQLALAPGGSGWSALRSAPPPDLDLTTEPVWEEPFLIPRGEAPIPVTAYCLQGRRAARKPAVVYFHGGGFCMGSRRGVEHSMRLLAQLSGGVVFSVEYRLAPEHRFPCATEDAWFALRWLHRHAADFCADRAGFSVSGDSAGGNLAAACARRDRNMRTALLRRQLLVYPVLSLAGPGGTQAPFSIAEYEINEAQKQWILPCITSMQNAMEGTRLYTSSEQEDRSPDASPLLDTRFAGLPPTVLFCAEFDYLTWQAKAYARQLAAAGVEVSLILYRGMHHGFMNRLGQYPQAAALHREMAEIIRQGYGCE